MKTKKILGVLGLLAGVAGWVCAAEPVLWYDFNETASPFASKGTTKEALKAEGKKQKAGGKGVSGKAWDLAWDASENTTRGADEPANSSRLVTATGAIKGMDNLEAFTVTMWFTSEQSMDSAMRFFAKTDSVVKGKTGFMLRSYSPESMKGKGAVELRLGNGEKYTALMSDVFPKGSGFNIWGKEQKWVFMAVSWDGKMVRFYAGGVDARAVAAGARAYAGKLVDAGAKYPLMLANTPSKNRGLDGKVDNFRFYREALGLEEIEKIREEEAEGQSKK